MERGYEEALRYAQLGWRVVPVKSGTKRPPFDDWPDLATVDPEQIERWWEKGNISGVSIVTGADSNLFVLDVDTKDNVRGEESLADLEAKHGKLPVTVESVTGSGGRHLFFRWPEDQEIDNSAGRLGKGLDIRGTRGQVVAPGSLHPDTGNTYEWELESHPDDIPVASAPQWLLELIKPIEHYDRTHASTRTSLAASEVALEKYNGSASNQDIADLLIEVGWSQDYIDRDGVIYMRRPGKKSGYSASIGKVAEGVMYCFTPNAPPFQDGVPYDPVGVLAYTKFGGDITAADKYLVSNGMGFPSYFDDDRFWDLWAEEITARAEESASRDTFTLSDVWDVDFEVPMPDALLRDDGKSCIYEKKIHTIVGEPETGKSWLAGYLMVERMKQGQGTIYWDFESDIGNYMYRIKLMGLTKNDAVDISHYWKGGAVNTAVVEAMIRKIKQDNIKYVVMDSVNRMMGKGGYDYESGPSYVKFTAEILDPIRNAGVAVILIDHVTKAKDSRGRYATGSEQKLSQVDVSIHLESIQPFAQGVEGSVGIRIAKDRLGGIKEACKGGGERLKWGIFHIGEEVDTGQKIVRITEWLGDKGYQKRYPGYVMEQIMQLVGDLNAVSEEDINMFIEGSNGERKYAVGRLMTLQCLSYDEHGAIIIGDNKVYIPKKDSYHPDYDPDFKMEDT